MFTCREHVPERWNGLRLSSTHATRGPRLIGAHSSAMVLPEMNSSTRGAVSCSERAALARFSRNSSCGGRSPGGTKEQEGSQWTSSKPLMQRGQGVRVAEPSSCERQ